MAVPVTLQRGLLARIDAVNVAAVAQRLHSVTGKGAVEEDANQKRDHAAQDLIMYSQQPHQP